MHFVFLNQYYPPDAAPTGVMLGAVVGELCARGHEVTVICAAGGYAEGAGVSDVNGDVDGAGEGTEALRGLRVLRIPATRFGRGSFLGKLVDYASYYVGAKWRLLRMRPRPERVVALTTPPYLSLVARVFSKFRGADHAHWVMDLYPDVMVAHGMLRSGGLPHRLLAGLARLGFGGGRCAGVITLGPDMAESVGAYVDPARVKWVPLWGTDVVTAGGESAMDEVSEVAALRARRGWAADEVVVMYSGNMGLGHRFGEMLSAARELAGPGRVEAGRFRFVFFGAGKRRGEIEDFVREHPGFAVELHPYAPAGELAAHLRSADVHLASLAEEWSGTMVPSKLQGIFAVGRPVVFVGSGESSIGRWVHESGGGWRVRPGDHAAMRRALAEAADLDVRKHRGERALAFAEERFQREKNVMEIVEILTADQALVRVPQD